ncbi:hypothetical protein [Streptomyces herbicida]|uniref:hypothetical protein n=1 Tax=Streptomyces herbicida TaxID=3065675 RepID=UPI002931DD2D|nr:hypothetical protein [Streptomyces sp. NEAU-HV9]
MEPASAQVPWSARYEFHSTTGSYKPHFWAGESWDDVREFAGPVLRRTLDAFLGHLVWDGGGVDEVVVVPDSGPFPGDCRAARPGPAVR